MAKRKLADSKEDRWRSFHIDEIKQRDYKIDSLKWLKEDALDGEVPSEPEELVTDAISELKSAVVDLEAVLTALGNGDVEAPTESILTK